MKRKKKPKTRPVPQAPAEPLDALDFEFLKLITPVRDLIDGVGGHHTPEKLANIAHFISYNLNMPEVVHDRLEALYKAADTDQAHMLRRRYLAHQARVLALRLLEPLQHTEHAAALKNLRNLRYHHRAAWRRFAVALDPFRRVLLGADTPAVPWRLVHHCRFAIWDCGDRLTYATAFDAFVQADCVATPLSRRTARSRINVPGAIFDVDRVEEHYVRMLTL